MNDPRLEAWLATMAAALSGFEPAAREDIAAELRSHMRDSLASGRDIEAILAGLGDASAVATLYRESRLRERALARRSPWGLMESALRWASLSATGIWVLGALVIGYTASLSLFLAAVRKVFAPASAGLWRLADGTWSLRLGFGNPPAGEDVLGWWMVPIGLVLGALGTYATSRFGVWSLGALWPRPVLPTGGVSER